MCDHYPAVLVPIPMDWRHYHPLATVYGWLEVLARAHPALVRLQVLGATEEGRKMVAVHIGAKSGEQSSRVSLL